MPDDLPDGRRDEVGEALAELGRVALLETVGRRSGRPLRTPVGFVEDASGALVVAAGRPDAAWALNLLEQPRCVLTIGAVRRPMRAVELDAGERAAAVRDLILRYGTPAEGLGRGPAFRLVPLAGADGVSAGPSPSS